MLKLRQYNFGLSRSTGKMRFRCDGEETLVDRIAGQWWTVDASRKGNITAECALDVKHGTAYVYHPDVEAVTSSSQGCDLKSDDNHDNCQVATDSPFPQGKKSHWRLCYAREIAVTSEDAPCWRLRDERTDELWFVKNYQGPMNVNWFDHGTHIFHDGTVTVDQEGVAHFAP